MCKSCSSLDYMATAAVMQLAAIFGMVVGMTARFWWTQQTAETRQLYSAVVWENRLYVGLAVACCLGIFGAFLWHHTELEPWTGSRRLFLFNGQMLMRQAEREAQELLELTRSSQLDTAHPVYMRVADVTSRLLAANSGVDAIRDRQWTVVVVDGPTVNAIVEPNGLVLVYVGLTSMANDDQLAILIGHELAHCLLRHANQLSSIRFVIAALCLVPVIPVIWALLPFGWNILAHLYWLAFLMLCVVLPCVRSCEIEADRVGMELAAKACVDVKQGYRFWDAMAVIDSRPKLLWLLSMHPTNESRSRHLFSLIPVAMEIQRQAGC
ncbi:metalloendopeptidase OMA1, mitochondrial-like [Metopolophium dirhodum]|uniref:metalloendopeptidase OMA1, mitochondrial-like n=1 Tax=Metopolophium dirhodum TaxID=44670 RepID=UPI0029907166|nr:metalloendopeptidase OMA1, mitochondrial-like [Metopolophium dirhodum]XP_060857232.1 metalloendopeptidase OMA1, mitochondrial-like [Metopolophium dirhodum]